MSAPTDPTTADREAAQQIVLDSREYYCRHGLNYRICEQRLTRLIAEALARARLAGAEAREALRNIMTACDCSELCKCSDRMASIAIAALAVAPAPQGPAPPGGGA